MRVGIVQNSIIYGGRLAVIIKITELLNEKGIVPDFITFKMRVTSAGIKERYGAEVSFRIRKIETILSRFPHEANILTFGLALKRICRDYDYFIDSNNTSFLMPSQIPIFSYVHFPRIARLKSKYLSIHKPDGPKKKWTNKQGIYLKTLGLVYSFDSISDNNFLTANSEYTRSCIQEHYPKYKREIPVIYPPVNMDSSYTKRFSERPNNISSIGRFCKAKRQFEQIKLAQTLPDWDFHLIGFAKETDSYLKRCRKYTEEQNLSNVFFHLNISNKQKKKLLRESKFFIHTNINEPFGITTVEAISNGCVPLVHNSGGQKEIVPFEELHFERIEDLTGFFEGVSDSKKAYNELIQKLIQYCKSKYSSNIFEKRFGNCLNDFEKDYL
ncbi:glycosyltransferase [Planctomycetota bacterium]